jgi:UDP-N-acetylmuramoyl-L-alanyl-D-glutamate--2,6-diaminopimelate ligase
MTPTIADRLAAAEPAVPRDLDALVERIRAIDPATVFIPPSPSGGAVAAATVRGVTNDSRTVAPGCLFVAVPGMHADGHAFAERAVAAGAGAVIVERPLEGLPAAQIVVGSARRALAEAAAWWYGDPSREIGVIGITGTDGKTTTSFLAAAALAAAGLRPGLVGTVATQIGGVREANPEHNTTPEAPHLQKALRAMVEAGDPAAIIETTSHGLALDRVAAIGYDLALFTNLSHEHLDLHGTFEAYRDAKRTLFDRLAIGPNNPIKPGVGWPRTGIVNVDDASGPIFEAATLAAGAQLLRFGSRADADVRLLEAIEDGGRLIVRYMLAGAEARLHLRLAGRFNASNALGVVAIGIALGLDAAAVRDGLETAEPVPGRMERIDRGQPFGVVVDYAHSPASLALLLDELGPTAAARGGGLIAVFGSAGERDRDKRPMMGRLAAQRARIVIATDEDPRAEDAAAIVAEIAAGARAAAVAGRPEAILEIPDRRAAIREAMTQARPGDVVVLAGKGHENTILYASHAEPWDERAEAIAALAELGFGEPTAG